MMIISLQMYLQQVEIRNTERVVYGGESRLDVFLRWLGGTPGPTRLPFRYSVHGSPLNNNFTFLSCVQNVFHWSSIFLLCTTQHSICLFIQPGKWLTNNFLQMLQFCEKIGWLVGCCCWFSLSFYPFFSKAVPRGALLCPTATCHVPWRTQWTQSSPSSLPRINRLCLIKILSQVTATSSGC